ncbi:barren [Saitoella complicata NRRL Y-17804]|uniref:Condensin complex subunit 2 n=1 Tax=Saitoella complicata (strain BCRC 22490 / CBS 7301 / JCM 7358 / NBRC 10748 / NRRL Y-17804) TaxID=698492 RepID=A0A0E9NCI3_SAICN|nr:barren [Saitoella complicata NRRL Y-17804]ODQ55291.1 barren [Saitoella complicata NRRL Y-17804]GAO47125.1 hypothetical protein G7K_1336-t1 [Saitoella complicata NRRL Y-17804]
MPRIRAAPSTPSTPARGSPLKHACIPTNDDENEKAARRAVRVAQDDLRRSTIVAAASPRKQSMAVGGPSTPARKVNSVDPAGVGRSPVPKVPVLANFEEWMKMATDNKINAANSWNFALIDYFHEMSLLREGDSINFQKASCTLDGCVKIYTSRVDSVATDTTKLLSGLATSKQSRDEEDRGEGEGDEDDEDREKNPKRRAARAEATLVKDFSSIQLKKFDLEFSVDPLFKKTSADFDEGGAKGLLLNHLGINEEGKIIFDASDAVPADADDVLPEVKEEDEGGNTIDIAALGAKFFADMDALDDMDVCPSLKNFEFPVDGSTITFDLPDLKLPDLTDDAASEIDGNVMGDDDAHGFGEPLEGFDNDDDVAFGEGGDAWAQTELPPNYDGGENEQLLLEEGAEPLKDLEQKDGFVMSLNSEGSEEGIFAYFDEALRKNWAGPEHWRISRLKKASTSTGTEPKKKKEKEVFSIDFYGDDVDEDVLFAPGGANINMSKAQQMQRSRHLLPDDMGFSSKDLLRLFLKPKATLQNRKKKLVAGGEKEVNEHDMDEKFWAERAAQNAEDDVPSGPSYDAAFFDDGNADAGFGPEMDDDDDGFADAAETLSQAAELKEEMDFGSQLVSQGRKMRPEYVNYARVAKKVDVKKLKDNIWSNLAITIPDNDDPTPTPEPSLSQGEEKKFTQVIQDLQKVYPQKEMEDVSTSFCFICLLHLANEKGLIIQNEGVGNMEELIIRKDMTVGAIDTY